MPPNDQAPRYQLVDPSTGNVVGSVFGDGDGNVVIADETDTQTTFDSDGVTTPALEANTELKGPTASEGDTVTLPDNPDVVPIYFDSETGQPLVPDLEETV
jgi:hypothetical protein